MGRQEGSASTVSYEEGRLSLSTGHFDMTMVKQAITRYRRSGSWHHPAHLQPLLVRAGAWLSLRLHELHAWDQGLFGLDGGTLVIHPSSTDTVTMLPIDVHDNGGSLIFSAAENTTGILLVNLVRARQDHAPVQLVFQGCALQFAQYDPMTDITLVGLVLEYELPHGWVAVRMDGNPWHINTMVQPPGVRKPVLRREWQADECETVTLSLSG